MSIRVRSWQQHAMRWLLAVGILVTPLIGARLPMLIFPVAVSILLAYDGLGSRVVVSTVIFLLIAELVWGMQLGSWSLAYLATALIMRSGEGIISLVPWAQESGWAIASLIRTVLLAGFLSGIMSVISVVIRLILYTPMPVGKALMSLGWSMVHSAPEFSLMIVVGVVVLARIDRPFRRSVQFGI